MKKRSLPSWASSPSSSSAAATNNQPNIESSPSSQPSSNNTQSSSSTTSSLDENNIIIAEQGDRNYLSPFEMSKKRKIQQDDHQLNSQPPLSDITININTTTNTSNTMNDENKEMKYDNLIKPNKELINKYINFYMKHERLIILDCETTGFTKNDQVIELAAIEVINGMKTGLIFNSRIKLNENVKIHEKAFAVHNISENDLAMKPSSLFIYSNFINFLNHNNHLNTGIIAHNLNFDLRMIKQDILKYLNNENNDKLPNILIDTNKHFCTMNFYKNIRGKNNSYDLDSTLHYFGINKKSRQDYHTALIDTELTFELFKSLKQYIEFNINNQSIQNYYNLLNSNNNMTLSNSNNTTNTINNNITKNNDNTNLVSDNNIVSAPLNIDNNTIASTSHEMNEDYSIFTYIKDIFTSLF